MSLPVQWTRPSDLVGVRVLDEVRFDSIDLASWRINFRADDEIYLVSEYGMFRRHAAPRSVRSASARVVNFVEGDGGDSVVALDESTGMAVLVVRMRPDQRGVGLYPISSGIRLSPHQSAMMVTRPQIAPVSYGCLVISDAGDWVVEDVLVGNQSQLRCPGELAGSIFDGVGGVAVRMQTILPAQDFSIVARYVGERECGAVFRAALVAYCGSGLGLDSVLTHWSASYCPSGMTWVSGALSRDDDRAPAE